MDSLLVDLDTATVDDKLRPVFAFIRKLTLSPSKITQGDADAVFGAGWNERALHDAIEVCALFSFMNRYVEGHGLVADPDGFKLEGSMLKGGYTPLLKALGIE